MKIAVIAADGRSGQAFTKEALKQGHTVYAGVYSTNPFNEARNLHVLQCDALNRNDIKRLLSDCNVVVSLIGHSKNSPNDIQTKAIKNIIDEMHRQSISRLVSLTGSGVRMPGDNIRFLDRILNATLKLVDPERVNDGIQHFSAMKKSGLDWTLLRVLKLQNTPPRDFTLKPHGPTKLIVSREEVAEAIIKIIEQGLYIQSAPIIAPHES